MAMYSLAEAKRKLAQLGIRIDRNTFDDYVVRPAGLKGRAAADASYFTDDIDDAVGTGIIMANRERQP